jgi:hypothetical protein
MFKSTDGGASWSGGISPNLGCSELDSSYLLSMVLDPTDRNTLYVGEIANSGLLKSNDGGVDWSSVWDQTNLLSDGVRTLVIDPTKPTTLYAGNWRPEFRNPARFPYTYIWWRVQKHGRRRELGQHRPGGARRQCAGD